MAHALAQTSIRLVPAECLRMAIVIGCALALTFAGRALPIG
jgi:hypothetical protein